MGALLGNPKRSCSQDDNYKRWKKCGCRALKIESSNTKLERLNCMREEFY